MTYGKGQESATQSGSSVLPIAISILAQAGTRAALLFPIFPAPSARRCPSAAPPCPWLEPSLPLFASRTEQLRTRIQYRNAYCIIPFPHHFASTHFAFFVFIAFSLILFFHTLFHVV